MEEPEQMVMVPSGTVRRLMKLLHRVSPSIGEAKILWVELHFLAGDGTAAPVGILSELRAEEDADFDAREAEDMAEDRHLRSLEGE